MIMNDDLASAYTDIVKTATNWFDDLDTAFTELKSENDDLKMESSELLKMLELIVEHGERLNTAFYVGGKRKDMIEVMAEQKELLQECREAIEASEYAGIE